MKIILDARERNIIRADTTRLFAFLTVALPAAAAWFAVHREQLPTWAVLAGGTVLSAIGLILRFRPQAQVAIDVVTGGTTMADGAREIVDSLEPAEQLPASAPATDAGNQP